MSLSASPLEPALAAAAAGAAVLGVRARAARRHGRAPAAPRRGPLAGRQAGRRLGRRLDRAGIPLGPDAFAALVALGALLAAALAWVVLRLPLLAPAGAAGVVLAARGVLASADERYAGRVAQQLPSVTRQLASALSAGLSLRQALARAARDAPEPAASELRRTASDMILGARVEEALDAMTSRLPDADLRVMVAAIEVQRQTGGDLARALAELGGRLEERGRLRRELRGATAQARLTAWMVAALPAVGGLAVEAASPGTLAATLGHGPGLALLAVAGALEIVGVGLVRRLARVEP
jgi:tight adherence protein B